VRPAINVGISVSRVGSAAQVTPMKKVAGRLKLELSQYRDLEAFAQFGSDLDADTQRTLARGARLVKTLNQGERQPLAVADQVLQVFAATNGFIDRIVVDKVPDFLDGLTQRFHSEGSELHDKVQGGDWSDETQEAMKKLIGEFADDYGYDLDEEGQPLEEGAEGDSERAKAREQAEASSDGEGSDEASEEETSEREAEATPA
jgi:F-type H+/Na+-transporting ATPase subunit alpha